VAGVWWQRHPARGSARILVPALAALLALALAGCERLRSLKIFAPVTFGMTELTPTLFVDPQMPAAERSGLRRMVEQTHDRLVGFFGSSQTTPRMLVCASQACFPAFGGGRPRALSFGETRLLLSPRGATGCSGCSRRCAPAPTSAPRTRPRNRPAGYRPAESRPRHQPAERAELRRRAQRSMSAAIAATPSVSAAGPGCRISDDFTSWISASRTAATADQPGRAAT